MRTPDRSDRTKDLAKAFILENNANSWSLEKDGKEVMLYHLKIIKVLMTAKKLNDLRAYHYVLLRQALESISSFFGRSQFSSVLNHIGITEVSDVAFIVNTLSHRKFYTYESDMLQDKSLELMLLVLTQLQKTYGFEVH